jgi:hypothetical protein
MRTTFSTGLDENDIFGRERLFRLRTAFHMGWTETAFSYELNADGFFIVMSGIGTAFPTKVRFFLVSGHSALYARCKWCKRLLFHRIFFSALANECQCSRGWCPHSLGWCQRIITLYLNSVQSDKIEEEKWRMYMRLNHLTDISWEHGLGPRLSYSAELYPP